LRIEARGHLYSHTGREKQQVEGSQIPLFVPNYVVSINNPGQDRIAVSDLMSVDCHSSSSSTTITFGGFEDHNEDDNVGLAGAARP
jgi:hypothetical protein